VGGIALLGPLDGVELGGGGCRASCASRAMSPDRPGIRAKVARWRRAGPVVRRGVLIELQREPTSPTRTAVIWWRSAWRCVERRLIPSDRRLPG
jgi:hypothetical protein